MQKITYSLFLSLIIALSWSCQKSNNSVTVTPPVYTVPTTYNFASFNDSNQVKLLVMADQIVAAINRANTIPNTVVSAQTLTDMLNNTGGYFNDSALKLNSSGLKLADYFSAAAKTDMLNYFDSIGLYSQSSASPGHGVAGVASSAANPNKKYLLSPNGIFYSQVVKKTFMGVFSYQIASVYLADSINNKTDTTILQHYWDAAFGFFGVPVNFPTNTTGLKYLGSYSNQVDAGLHSNASIMNAFLKGRAAIGANDLATMKAQAGILINTFDSLDAAAIVQEMHETNTNIEAGDAVAAYGTLSESLGFVRNLIYNTSPAKAITNAQIAQLLALYDSSNPNSPDLYLFVNANVNTTAQIEAKTAEISALIGQIYGFSATTLSLL
ncbi:MAG TPA: DUF4856 domain-containing protein [Puia sp.]|jgi:hypothetical protein|nr:DUF4856 domain-containing protein [Puia sp.]